MPYITNPPCSPSRCCLMTGMYAQRFGKSGMARGLPIPDDHPTLAEFMRDAGYVTGQVGKWDIGSNRQGPHQRGFMEVARNAPGAQYDREREDGSYVLPHRPRWRLHGRVRRSKCRQTLLSLLLAIRRSFEGRKHTATLPGSHPRRKRQRLRRRGCGGRRCGRQVARHVEKARHRGRYPYSLYRRQWCQSKRRRQLRTLSRRQGTRYPTGG